MPDMTPQEALGAMVKTLEGIDSRLKTLETPVAKSEKFGDTNIQPTRFGKSLGDLVGNIKPAYAQKADGHYAMPWAHKDEHRGIALARKMRTALYAHQKGVTTDNAIREIWGDTDREDINLLKYSFTKEYAEHVRKGTIGTVVKALGASTVAGGGALLDPMLLEVVELLYDVSTIRQAGARTIEVPNGRLDLGRVTSGATAAWVGESQNATSSQQQFETGTLNPKKLAIIVPISNDLLRSASFAVDQIVRDDMAASAAAAEDNAGLLSAGSANMPKGLYGYSQVVQNALDTNGLQPGRKDVVRSRRLLKQQLKNHPMQRPAWIFNSESWEGLYSITGINNLPVFQTEMDQGKLLQAPFFCTEQIGSAYAVGTNSDCTLWFHGDFADLIIGEQGGVEIETFPNGTYNDGTNLQSGISRDESVVRLLRLVDFLPRRFASFVIRTGVRNLADG